MKLLKFVFSIYGLIIFVVLMLILFPFFLIAFFRGKVKGGNMIYFLARIWADIFFIMTGMKFSGIYEAPHDASKEYIFVSNHISYMDIPMMMKVFRQQYFRILGKADMNKIPIFGSIYKRGTVSVFRDNPAARAKSIRELIAFLDKKLSVFICPEGTFNMTHKPLKEFYNGAFRIAIETGKPVKPVLFLDTYDRLNYHSIFSLNPGPCRAVYLKETDVRGLTLEDVEILKQIVYDQMQEALIRYRASWIKNDRTGNERYICTG